MITGSPYCYLFYYNKGKTYIKIFNIHDMHISKEEIKGEKKKEVDILKYRKVKVFTKKVRKYFFKK